MQLFRLAITAACALSLMSQFCRSAFGQPGLGAQQGQVVEFDQMYNQRYAGQPPLEGEIIENVSVFDADGNPFELESTRGKYTVLVFGCLT